MKLQQAIENYNKAADAAMAEARQNGKWDKNTLKAKAEAAAAKALRQAHK